MDTQGQDPILIEVGGIGHFVSAPSVDVKLHFGSPKPRWQY